MTGAVIRDYRSLRRYCIEGNRVDDAKIAVVAPIPSASVRDSGESKARALQKRAYAVGKILFDYVPHLVRPFVESVVVGLRRLLITQIQ